MFRYFNNEPLRLGIRQTLFSNNHFMNCRVNTDDSTPIGQTSNQCLACTQQVGMPLGLKGTFQSDKLR